MKAINPTELKTNQKAMLDLAFNGETLLVARPAKKNVVVISETEFNKLTKAKRNLEYLAKLNESMERLDRGEGVRYTREQRRAMETE